jgi:hypothetical protein
MTSQAARRADGSKPVVGSSRKMSSGVPDQRQRDVQPSALSAGQLGAKRVRLSLEAD